MVKRTRIMVKPIMMRTDNMSKDRKVIMIRRVWVRTRRMARKNMVRRTQVSTDKIYKLRINK